MIAAAFGAACGSQPAPAARGVVTWRAVGSWSGQGNAQTESFTSESGALRVRWETKNEDAPGAGTFRFTIHSAISGRPLLVAVDRRGIGRDTAYVDEDPRVFYGVVESARVEWSFTIEEPVAGDMTDQPRR